MKRALAVVLLAGCSDKGLGPYGAFDGGGGASPPTGSTSSASSSSTGIYSTCGIENGQRPASVPESWVPWTCAPGCVFWIPPDPASLPAPIQWRSCPAAAELDDCRMMVTDWSDGEDDALGRFDLDFVAETGRLQFMRLAVNGSGDGNSYIEHVVGDVDGDLDFAMRSGWQSSCNVGPRGVSENAFAFSTRGPEKDVDALMIGALGELDPIMPYRDATSPGISSWYLGAEWLIKQDYGDVVTAYAHHDMSSGTLLYQPSMNPEAAGFGSQPLFFGRDILFQSGNLVTASIWAYDDQRGTHPLISFVGDGTRGAANVGSDGKDMVWTYGEGKTPPYAFGLYPTVSIMTAPFTTDPAALRPRRLRSDMNLGIGTKEIQFAVGCGFAGRMLADQRVEIVRIEDGGAWVLDRHDLWEYGPVLGFTCEEVFVTAFDHEEKTPNVARISLASLGEPLPPD